MIEASGQSGAPRSVASMQILAALAEERGLCRRACLAGTGLRDEDLDDASAMVSAEQERTLIRNLLRHVGGEPTLGLRAGLRYHFTALGSVGFALASSPTLGSAIEFALRYLDLTFALTSVALDRDERECRILLSADDTEPELRHFALERSVGVLFSLSHDLFGNELLCKRVALTTPTPPCAVAATYEGLLGIAPMFGATQTVVVLDVAALGRPLVQASPVALRMAEEQCQRLMAERRARSGFAGRVRDRIARRGGALPDMEAVAAELHLSPRTLRRRLHDEGTAYSTLCDEVRETYAEELLAIADLSVEQVAERLGYADATSFIAAFKRWKGLTPHRYRHGPTLTAR